MVSALLSVIGQQIKLITHVRSVSMCLLINSRMKLKLLIYVELISKNVRD